MCNPPSFYDDEIMKQQKKYDPFVQSRQIHKKKVYSTFEWTGLTKNLNVRNPEQLITSTYAANKLMATSGESTFKKALQRRKSRQSTYSPNCVDFDYIGNSASFEHCIKKQVGMPHPNSSQINFEMKLRGYKNTSDFLGEKPFEYPEKKSFSPVQVFSKKQ